MNNAAKTLLEELNLISVYFWGTMWKHKQTPV